MHFLHEVMHYCIYDLCKFFFSRVAMVELYFTLELFSSMNIDSYVVPLLPRHGFISILCVSMYRVLNNNGQLLSNENFGM